MIALLDANAACPSVKLLTPPVTWVKALLPEYASEVDAPLSVTTLCGDDSAYAEATHFTEFLRKKLGPGIAFQVDHWTFEELEHCEPVSVRKKLHGP